MQQNIGWKKRLKEFENISKLVIFRLRFLSFFVCVSCRLFNLFSLELIIGMMMMKIDALL